MADVAMLSVVEADHVDYDNIKAQSTGTSYAPPPEGIYVGKAPIFKDDGGELTNEFTDTRDFALTQQGYMKVKVDPIEIVGPTGTGYKIRFQMPLSVKKYSNREGNSTIEFLRACNIAARPQVNAEYRAAIKQASGKTFQFGLVWEAYDKDTQVTTKGESNFPPDPNDPTKHLPYLDDGANRVWANGKVKFYKSAIVKA